MKDKQAVRVTTPQQYSEVVSWLTGKGFKPFQLFSSFDNDRCITIEDNYLNVLPADLEGYEIIDFEDFKKTNNI
jgi:hypothetical protein